MGSTLHHLTVKAHRFIVRIKDSVNELRNACQLKVQVPNHLQGAVKKGDRKKNFTEIALSFYLQRDSSFVQGVNF